MLTEEESVLIKRWNDFAVRPRGDFKKFREELARFVEEIGLNANLPPIAALHDDVVLRDGLLADVAVPNGTGPHPVVLLLHGGGWVAGSPKTHRKLGAQFAAQGYLTINLDYRLAPENPFPAGYDDCVFAANWTVENAGRWNGDASRMVIAGDSAGGNLTAAAMLSMASGAHAPKLRAGVLIYGVFDFAELIEKSSNRPVAEAMARVYCGGHYPAALRDPRVSPQRGIKPGVLPPCFVICGTADLLLPQSRAVANALGQAGIEYEMHEIEDMPHAFMMMDALAGCREGQRLMFDFLRRHV
jgi:acetyl esterase